MQETNRLANKMDEAETQKHSGWGKEPSATLKSASVVTMLTPGKEWGLLPHISNARLAILKNTLLLKLCFQLYSATDPMSFLNFQIT